MSLGGDETGAIQVRAPAMRTDRTRAPDNSMQAAIEALPGVTAPVVVVASAASAYQRYWYVSFTQMGDVPPLIVKTKQLCDLTKADGSANEQKLSVISMSSDADAKTFHIDYAASGTAGSWLTFWQGANDYIGEYIQFGNLAENSYDIYKVVARNEGTDASNRYVTVDVASKGFLSAETLQWCDSTTFSSTFLTAGTLKDGSLVVSVYPAFRAATVATAAVQRPKMPDVVSRTLNPNTGVAVFNGIAVVPRYFDVFTPFYTRYDGGASASMNNRADSVNDANLQSSPDMSVLEGVRAPLYRIKFAVSGLPAISALSSSIFSVAPNNLGSVTAFAPHINEQSSFGWYPEPNVFDSALELEGTYACTNRPVRVFARSHVLDTSNRSLHSESQTSATGYATAFRIAAVSITTGAEIPLSGILARTTNTGCAAPPSNGDTRGAKSNLKYMLSNSDELCGTTTDTNTLNIIPGGNWCVDAQNADSQDAVAAFDNVQVPLSSAEGVNGGDGKVRFRIFPSSLERASQQFPTFSLACDASKGATQTFQLQFAGNIVVNFTGATVAGIRHESESSGHSLERLLESSIFHLVEDVIVVPTHSTDSVRGATVCASSEGSGGLTYVALNVPAGSVGGGAIKSGIDVSLKSALSVSATVALDDSYGLLKVGHLWADWDTVVKQNQAPIAVQSSGSLQKSLQPYWYAPREYVSGTEHAISVALSPKLLKENGLFQVDLAVKNGLGETAEYKTLCTTRECGDTSLPRTLSLRAYGKAEFVNLYSGETTCTQDNHQCTTTRSIANEIAIGENLHIMAGTDSTTFSTYYVTGIADKTVTLDRKYSSATIPALNANDQEIISTLFTRRPTIDGAASGVFSGTTSGVTGADSALVKIENLSLSKPGTGVFIQANDETCYRLNEVSITFKDSPDTNHETGDQYVSYAQTEMEGRYRIKMEDTMTDFTNRNGPIWPPSELVSKSFVPGMQIFLEGPSSSVDKIVTVASTQTPMGDVTGIGGTTGYLAEPDIAFALDGKTYTGANDGTCIRLATIYALTLQASANTRFLSSGYFSLQVTHRGSTETTSRISYYDTVHPVVNTERLFLEAIEKALRALPNLDSSSVFVRSKPTVSFVTSETTATAKDSTNYFNSGSTVKQSFATGVSIIMYGVDRSISISFLEKKVKDTLKTDTTVTALLDSSDTNLYSLSIRSLTSAVSGTCAGACTDTNLYSSLAGPFIVSASQVSQLIAVEGSGESNTAQGWVARQPAVIPFQVRATDSSGADVNSGGSNMTELRVETIDDGRWQQLFCSANGGTFVLSFSLSSVTNTPTTLTTTPIQWNASAAEVSKALADVYTQLGTASVTQNTAVLQLTNDAAGLHVLAHVIGKDSIRVVPNDANGLNCSTSPETAGFMYSVAKVDMTNRRITVDALYTDATSSVFICVQPFPRPTITLGANQGGVCLGRDKSTMDNSDAIKDGLGPNPQPLTIRLSAHSSFFWKSYPTIFSDASQLNGNGGAVQVLHCTSASSAGADATKRGNMFRLEFRGQTTQWIDVKDTVSTLGEKLRELTTLANVSVASDTGNVCAAGAGQLVTITIDSNNQDQTKGRAHNYAPPFTIQDQRGDANVAMKTETEKGKITMVRHVGTVLESTTGGTPSHIASIGEDGTATFTNFAIQREGLFTIRARHSSRSGVFAEGSLIQSITCKARAGAFMLSFGGAVTLSISFDATASTVETAVLQLSRIASAKVHVTKGDITTATVCTEIGDAPFYVEIIQVVDDTSTTLSAADFAFLPLLAVEDTQTLSISPVLESPALSGKDATGIIVIEKLYASRGSPIAVAPARPNRLVVLKQPSSANAAGIRFATQPVYELVDVDGNRVAGAVDSVRVSLIKRNRHVTLRCDASGGTFRIKWNQNSRTSAIRADFNASQLQETLLSLPSINAVNVTCYKLGTGFKEDVGSNGICSDRGDRVCDIHLKTVNCSDFSDEGYFSKCDSQKGFVPALVREAEEGNLLTGGAATLLVEADSKASLLGTTIVPLDHGIAAFSDLAIDRVGSGYTIVAELLNRPSVSGGPGTITEGDAGKPIRVDISYPSGLVILQDSIPDQVIPTADVPYLTERLQKNHIVRVAVTDLGGNMLPQVGQTDSTISARFINASSGVHFAATAIVPANVSIVNGIANFSGLHCAAGGVGAGSELHIEFSTNTPDLLHGGHNVTMLKIRSPRVHRCIGPVSSLSLDSSLFSQFPGGAVKLPMLFRVQNGSRTVTVDPHAVSVMDVLSRLDAVYFSVAPTADIVPYIVHPSDTFDAFHVPLDRPYNGTQYDGEYVSAWRVATGGVPLPQQPLVTLRDSNGHIVEFDELSQVHVSLRPDPLTIRCGGSIDGTNRIQTVSCDSGVGIGEYTDSSSQGSFVLSFNGEVTGSILPNDSRKRIEELILALPSVRAARVEIVETSSVFTGVGNMVSWRVPEDGGTACTLGFNTSIRVFLDDVINYPSTDQGAAALPLISVIPDRVQALTCISDPHASGSSFALTFARKTTAPLPANATTSEFRAALEALSNVHLSGVRYVNVTSATAAEAAYPCSKIGDVRVLVTLKKVGVMSDAGSSLGLHASRIPLLEVAGVAGNVLEDSIESGRLFVEQDTLFQTPKSKNPDAVAAQFHVSGSTHAGPIDLKHSSATPGVVDFSTEWNYKPLSISRICPVQAYEPIFTLVDDGGTVVNASKHASTKGEIAGPAIPIYAGKPEHLRIAVQPAGASVWPKIGLENDVSLPINTNPVVHIVDAGGNLAAWVSGTPVVVGFDLPGALDSTVENPMWSTLYKAETMHGVADFAPNELRVANNIDSGRQFWLRFWTTSTGNCSNSSLKTETWCKKGAEAAAGENTWSIFTNPLNSWVNGQCQGDLSYKTEYSCGNASRTSMYPFPPGITKSNALVISESFPIVGKPQRTRWLVQPPVNATSGDAFTVQIEVLDEFGSRVFQYDAGIAQGNNIVLPTVSILMREWNDPRCPLSCAKTGSVLSTLDVSSGSVGIKKGVVTFSNVTIVLPANTGKEGHLSAECTGSEARANNPTKCRCKLLSPCAQSIRN